MLGLVFMKKIINWIKLNKKDKLFLILFSMFCFLLFSTSMMFFSLCAFFNISKEIVISAYTNLLVFNATIFAPLAAYFFIDNWKDQKNLSFFSKEAKKLWLSLQKTEDYSYIIDRLIDKHNINYYNQHDEFSIFFNKLTNTLNEVHYFIELTDDREVIGEINDSYISCQNIYEIFLENGDFHEQKDKKQRTELIEINEKIRIKLKKYIIIN